MPQTSQAASDEGVSRPAFLLHPVASSALILAFVTAVLASPPSSEHASPFVITRADGLTVAVSHENTQPSLAVWLPGRPAAERAALILFPEHVTARTHGESDVRHLYLFTPGTSSPPPHWYRTPDTLEYERDLAGPVHLVARATLESDGIRFRYEFTNRSAMTYDLIYAVTDPRLQSVFHDVRLERTYVHTPRGFELLASELPSRLTMPLTEWLPTRVLASVTWPVPETRIERRDDGITYRYRSQKADEPLLVTRSLDHTWVAASFSREAGNVWSNPDLTCQHVDPQASLPAGGTAVLEVKLLFFRGSLDDVQRKVLEQRASLAVR